MYKAIYWLALLLAAHSTLQDYRTLKGLVTVLSNALIRANVISMIIHLTELKRAASKPGPGRFLHVPSTSHPCISAASPEDQMVDSVGLTRVLDPAPAPTIPSTKQVGQVRSSRSVRVHLALQGGLGPAGAEAGLCMTFLCRRAKPIRHSGRLSIQVRPADRHSRGGLRSPDGRALLRPNCKVGDGRHSGLFPCG